MKFKIIIFCFLILTTVISCKKSFHQDDLKYFSGNWKIEKVEGHGSTIENYGEITVDENGIGKMKLNYYPYDASSPATEGAFNIVTSEGIDTYIKLYGAYWLNPDGTYGHMMCDRESEVSVRILKLKKKSMQWQFAETTSIYDCDLRQDLNGNMTNVTWYLIRK
jgi:hypothetical protein